MNKINFDYHIKCINPVDYELNIILPGSHKIMTDLFQKTKQKLRRARGILVGGDMNAIGTFDVTEEYIPLIKVWMKKPFEIVKKEIEKDGVIKILGYEEVKDVKFIKNQSKDWDISINLTGHYAKM